MGGSVYELDVFKLAFKLSLEIHKVSLEFPKIEQFGGLADQMRRASRSICANLVEGLEKGSSKTEEKRFLSIAMGSVGEMRLWCKYAVEFSYMPKAKCLEWYEGYNDVGRMLRGLIRRR